MIRLFRTLRGFLNGNIFDWKRIVMAKFGVFAARGVIASLVLCLSVSACVTTSGQGNGAANAGSGNGDSECNEGLLALGGAVVGALLATGTNRVRGAALGAGVAGLACVAWNYNVKQTRTAQQVQTDYRTANHGQVPEQAQVVHYDTKFSPSGRVTPGGQLILNSDIEVIGGSRDQASPVVEEEMTMLRPDGKQVSSRKVVNEGQGAGGYQSSFTLKMPKGVPEGEYPVKTALYLNGQPAGARNLTMQVVRSDDGVLLVALR